MLPGMRTLICCLSLLAALPARAQIVLPPREACPAPRLPKGSLVYSSGESSAFGLVTIHNLGVDGQHVYWSDGRGQIWRAPKSGGSATRIVAEHGHSFLVLGSELVYASEQSIRKVATSGGTPKVVCQESEAPIELVSDGRLLYYSMFDGSPVRQLELASGKVLRRFPVVGQVTLALEPGYLYVASYKQGTITRHPTTGGVPRVLVRGERTLVGVTLDDKALYYSVEQGGFVKRIPKQGGPAVVLARDHFNQEATYVAGAYLYWFDWRGGRGQHTLWRTLRAGGGAVEKVQGGLCSPHHLALDERHFYLENGGAGTVLRIPRPR